MNSNFWKLTLGLGGICAFGMLATAAPLQRAEVPANPAWLLHLDCDTLRPTIIGQYLLSEMDKPENKAKLASFQDLVGFDLRTQLHGVTLYGSSPAPEDGVLMVNADFDPARLVKLAESANDYQSSPHGKTVIHNWIDDKRPVKDGVEPRIYAAIQGKRVIFGQREDRVAQALDVLTGSASNLAASKNFPGLGVSGSTHFVEAAARKMKLPEGDPNAAILKMSQSVQLVLGESQKQVNGTITLVADSEAVSTNILSIAQGLLALVKMQTDKPEDVKLANALTLAQDGDRVLGTVTMPAADAIEIMKADAARKAALAAKKDKE